MDGIKKTNKVGIARNHASSTAHKQRVQKSSTLNRRFVKRPTAMPRINASAAAAAKTLRRSNQTRTVLAKTNSVRLQPLNKTSIQTKTQAAAKKQVAKAQTQAQAKVAQAKAAQQAKIAQAKALQQKKLTQAQAQASRLAAIRKEAAESYAQLQTKQKQQAVDKYERHAMEKNAKAKIAAQKVQPERLTAQEMKDRAIQQALRKMNAMDAERGQDMLVEAKRKKFWQGRKFAIASVVAVVSFALLGYLVYLNMPNISVRVAAIQTGIERAYPSYIPMNYRLDGLVKEENGRITMNFKGNDDKSFKLIEEKTAWDSAAVLTNYVKKNWGGEYSIAKGQGLTIYVAGSNAAWVNGGVLYIIEDASGSLTSSDLHDIAVSL